MNAPCTLAPEGSHPDFCADFVLIPTHSPEQKLFTSTEENVGMKNSKEKNK